MTSSISSLPNLRTLFSSFLGSSMLGTSTSSGQMSNLFSNNSISTSSNINLNNQDFSGLFSSLDGIIGQTGSSIFGTSSSQSSLTPTTQSYLSSLSSGTASNNNVNNMAGYLGTVTNNTNVNNNTTGSGTVANSTNVNNNTTGTVTNNTNVNNNTTGSTGTVTNNTNVNNNTTTPDYCPPEQTTNTNTNTTNININNQQNNQQNNQNNFSNFLQMMERFDPIGFETNGKRYELATDENGDGKFNGASELVGYDNDWSEMQALDTNKDGHINGAELDNVRLVSGGRDADIKTAGDLGLTDIDLTSYKDNKFNLTLNNKIKQGTQTYETQRVLNRHYRRAFGQSM